MTFIDEAVSCCKSAIGSMVTYIHECQQSGIPYHVADDAMGESRKSYQKYWKGAIHKDNEKGDGAKGGISNGNPRKRNLDIRAEATEKKILENRDEYRSEPIKKQKRDDCEETVNESKQNCNDDVSSMLLTLSSIQYMLEENLATEEETQLQLCRHSPRNFVIHTIRSQLIDRLFETSGNVNDESFKVCLDVLSAAYKSSRSNQNLEANSLQSFLSGNWVSLSKPVYQECLGLNDEGFFLYTLGRMSFGMFQPADLKCSVQSTHINIGYTKQRSNSFNYQSNSESDSSVASFDELSDCIPSSLKTEILDTSSSSCNLFDYDIEVSLTIEPQQEETTFTNTLNTNKKRQRALMSVKGYMVPDPETRDRFTIWFTGGKLQPAVPCEKYKAYCRNKNQCEDVSIQVQNEDNYGTLEDWQSTFNNRGSNKLRRLWKDQARLIAAKLLLGAEISDEMDENGAMKYTLHRPVGGHGKSYIDVLYLDDDILITRGNHGTIYVLASSAVPHRFAPMKRGHKKKM